MPRYKNIKLRTLREVQIDYIEQILVYTGGHVQAAAAILGVNRRLLQRLKRQKLLKSV